MSSLSDKSSRRRQVAPPLEDAPTQIVLDADPALLADSHASTAQLKFEDLGVQAGGTSDRNAVVITNEDKTVISKRAPGEDAPPPIHIGPLESRKSLEGETLDHFQLEKYVGGGGMGAVYRAHDKRLNRHVAVKILSRDQSDSETVRRFRNEAQSAARLDDPHIARVYYIGEDKGWNFIVFEFIEGTNLREMVEQRGPLPIEEALDYTLQVCEALHHAAARDVVHRDIKPSNVLVTADGCVKLVDMGLARLHQVESGSDDLTQSGVTLGTFDYISPEQARDPRSADVRSDIYSLGCTLYFMLAGRAPFPDGTALQKLIRHNSDDPPDVRLFRPDTPEEVVAILSRMLAKKPEQRFQSPAELVQAINRLSQRLQLNLGSSSTARLPVKWPQPGPEPTSWWRQLVPFGVAALVLVGLAFIPEGSHAPPAAPPAAARPEPPPTVAEALPDSIDDPIDDELDWPDERSTTPGVTRPAVAVTPTPTSEPEVTMPRIETPSANMLTTPVATVKRRIVVGTSMADDAITAATFAEACRLAARDDIELIELAFNGKKTVTSSLEINSERLTIRAAEGFTPELLLQPSPDAASDDRRLIRLTMPGGQISWEGIRIRFDVPPSIAVPAAISRPGWILIQYAPQSTVNFAGCVLSIANTTPALVRNSPQVAFFEPGPQVTMSSDAAPEDLGTPQLVVRQSVLRGDATVLRLPEDVDIRCQFTECFVASGDRFLETSGTSTRPPASDRIAVSLERSTVVASAGLLLGGAQSNRPYRMPIRLDLQNCVVVTDSASPVIEFREDQASEEPPLSIRGANNFFPRSTLFFRHAFRSEGKPDPKDTGFGSLPAWAFGLNTMTGELAAPAPETPMQDHLVGDYVLKSPMNTGAGCSAALLPIVEGAVRRPIMGATNMGVMKPDPTMTPMTEDKPVPRPTP